MALTYINEKQSDKSGRQKWYAILDHLSGKIDLETLYPNEEQAKAQIEKRQISCATVLPVYTKDIPVLREIVKHQKFN